MLFAQAGYLETLPHLGRATAVTGLPFPVAVRDIPGTAHADAIGPWPYVPAPEPAALAAGLAELRRLGLVTLTLMIAPDAGPADADAYAALGVGLRPLKAHFVIDPDHPPAAVGPRTRRNLTVAARHWVLQEGGDPAELAGIAGRLHADLTARRRLSDIARVPAVHFERLARLPGIACISARKDGTVGAMVFAARDPRRADLLHLLVDRTHIATCPGYAVLAHVARDWSRAGPAYLGGTPDGPDGPGVARFKARWANRTAPLTLATAVLRPDVYGALAGDGAHGGYFPAYRRPTATDALPD